MRYVHLHKQSQIRIHFRHLLDRWSPSIYHYYGVTLHMIKHARNIFEICAYTIATVFIWANIVHHHPPDNAVDIFTLSFTLIGIETCLFLTVNLVKYGVEQYISHTPN